MPRFDRFRRNFTWVIRFIYDADKVCSVLSVESRLEYLLTALMQAWMFGHLSLLLFLPWAGLIASIGC